MYHYLVEELTFCNSKVEHGQDDCVATEHVVATSMDTSQRHSKSWRDLYWSPNDLLQKKSREPKTLEILPFSHCMVDWETWEKRLTARTQCTSWFRQRSYSAQPSISLQLPSSAQAERTAVLLKYGWLESSMCFRYAMHASKQCRRATRIRKLPINIDIRQKNCVLPVQYMEMYTRKSNIQELAAQTQILRTHSDQVIYLMEELTEETPRYTQPYSSYLKCIKCSWFAVQMLTRHW